MRQNQKNLLSNQEVFFNILFAKHELEAIHISGHSQALS